MNLLLYGTILPIFDGLFPLLLYYITINKCRLAILRQPFSIHSFVVVFLCPTNELGNLEGENIKL